MSASEDDTRGYFVVVNDEEQYSIWLDGSDLPLGWRPEGLRGTKTECLEHIDRIWTDMRPASLRRAMTEPGPAAA